MTAPTSPQPCRRCRKPILWARTEATSSWLPLDPEPDESGNQAVFQDTHGAWQTRQLSADDKPYSFEKRHMPHVATCRPEAAVVPIKPPPNVIPISAARSIRRKR